MADMLVRLYELRERRPPDGVDVRRGLAAEKHRVVAWVRERFGEGWASECEVAFARDPISCLVALRGTTLIGFAVHDVTARGVFGPMGVDEVERRRGTGAALLVAALQTMRAQGHAYAVIGWVGPAEWYAKVAGAVPIPDSEPGMFRGLLR